MAVASYDIRSENGESLFWFGHYWLLMFLGSNWSKVTNLNDHRQFKKKATLGRRSNRVTTLQTEKIPDFSGGNCRQYIKEMHIYSRKICLLQSFRRI